MAKSKISAPVGFFNAKCKPQQWDIQETQKKLVFSFQENKTYTRYIADDGDMMYSIKIQNDGVILKHVIGADGIVKSPKTIEEKAIFCQLSDYMQTVKQQKQTQDNNRRMYNEHLRVWYTSDDGGLSWVQETKPSVKFAPKKNAWCQYEKQETPTIYQSHGFSLELIPSGKFITVEFINKRGEISRYNGRTGVKKYLKHSTIGNAERGDYFILWVRRGGIKFDTVAMVHKHRIVKLSAGGVVLWQNKESKYSKTV